ncbi:LysR family transcriptional regulator ArgP [Comamonas granuli]|uniref:LysR family transcriptional regulator ArgP n=1 Tax=Comamonas granuli TaxID=290309 RepID=UPI0005A7960A|nr:LysR family transcriptional regulator ArgP [Comamonas granuli]
MLDPTLLTTLAVVAREGSFERAARVLHVTPSAVSQRIRLLEDRAGAVLVVRGQPCEPTELGARLCRHAQTVALLEDELRRDLPWVGGQEAGLVRSTVRIAINADSLATWFITALDAFSAEDHTLVDVAVDDQDHTGDWLRRGHVLGAVTSLAQPIQGCRSRKLGGLRYLATASPAYVQRWFAQGVSPAALAQAPSLVFDRNDRLQQRWVRRAVRKEVPLAAHRLPSTQAFVDACLAGIGWGMNPWHLVQGHLQSGRLVELLPGRPLDVPLYWQWATLPLPALERLGQCVQQAARAALVSP